MYLIQAAVPVPLRQLFTYTHDSSLEHGVRVVVPFGKRELVGIVMESKPVGSDQEKAATDGTLKAVQCVLDTKPLIPDELLSLGKWLSDYYLHPIGDTLLTMLPSWLRKNKSEQEIMSLVNQQALKILPEGKDALSTIPANAKQQKRLLNALREKSALLSDVKQRFSNAVINALVDKQWAVQYQQNLEAKVDWQDKLTLGNKPIASREQGAAIGVITSQLTTFSVSLLDGVTGSGKTEVYLQVIETVLLRGRQVLVLVPEIGLTPQTVERFERRFGHPVGVLHSKVSDKKRMQIWLAAKSGKLPLIIGTRSAIFTPFYQLGLIVVDEEHDDSFKQQDGLRYHARDLAAVRAQRLGVPLVLGSATPSLETLNNALNGRYQHLHLSARAGGANPVSQYIQDMRNHPVQGGIAEHLIEKMQQHIQAGNQVLVFLNRRGFSPVLLCHACGHVEMCHRCDRPMTWHKAKRQLKCHHCDAQRGVPNRCDHCHSDSLIADGLGTEQLEQALQGLFPSVSIARIDRDATRTKDALEKRFDEIRAGKHQLLVGTQIVAKGHHFPDVTMVVIVDVDSALFSADLRAAEKLAQLVTQLAGRAGRAEKPGEMWLQTHHPGHPIVQELIHNGYAHVARGLLAERQSANVIPFSVQAIVKAESHEQYKVQKALQLARSALPPAHIISAIGPVQTLIEKKQGRYRMMLIVRASSRKALNLALRHLLSAMTASKEAKQVRWSLDVDAIDLT
ncbi:primosomal protein N' [Alteromonas sediminis]|uniref:Replication restart protein PriA n=1 Tax=Alteromonas sediminis TaxID=2259342 RepID=A0A3N5XWM9_9ALTE|nr:primosomal protein N' [Alteromonas sediminis]RPJ64810.1 primosomal protein N' [Alteromonas sediminis]